jgi:hypothetical protein
MTRRRWFDLRSDPFYKYGRENVPFTFKGFHGPPETSRLSRAQPSESPSAMARAGRLDSDIGTHVLAGLPPGSWPNTPSKGRLQSRGAAKISPN